MLESLFTSFGSGAIHRICMVTQITSNVLKALDQEFAQDKALKNTAIDALVDLLQKHKEV